MRGSRRDPLDVAVAPDPPSFSPDFARADLTIRVEEGRRYVLTDIGIAGKSSIRETSSLPPSVK